MKKRKAVFLDRDGTLNYDRWDYVKSLSEFRLFDFTLSALKLIHEQDYLLILITNQSALARDMIDTAELQKIHAFLESEIKAAGTELDGIYICPHHPEDNCDCRKPKIGNVLAAVRDHDIDLEQSFFIGDSLKDMETGKRAGCRTVFVSTGIRRYSNSEFNESQQKPDYIVRDLMAAAKLIQKLEGRTSPDD